MLISIATDAFRGHGFSRFPRELSPGSKAHAPAALLSVHKPSAIPLGVAVYISINSYPLKQEYKNVHMKYTDCFNTEMFR